MNSRTLLVASSVTFALVLLQFGLLVLRNHVRSHLFPPAMRVSTRQDRNPEPEE